MFSVFEQVKVYMKKAHISGTEIGGISETLSSFSYLVENEISVSDL